MLLFVAFLVTNPETLATLRDPFIMRDIRGQSVDIYPLQYNPVTKVLRVFSEITVTIANTQEEGINEFINQKRHPTIDPTFNDIYRNLFVNYSSLNRGYPTGEDGELLIICHPAFMADMKPYIDWKRTIGRKTTMVSTTTTGNTVDSIKKYIKTFYNNANNNLAYVLLVGDHPEEKPLTFTNTTIQSTVNKRYCPERNGPFSVISEPYEDPNDPYDKKSPVSSLSQYDEWNAAFEYWLNLLKATPEGSEEYYYILDKVSYYSALKDNYFNSIISARLGVWLEEKEEIGKESLYEDLRFLFTYRNHYTDNLSIAETYLAENNFAAASSTLSTIYEKFKLNEQQTSELLSLQIYVRWLQQLDEKGETIYKLPENEIEYLVNYVETNIGRGVVFANNILCGLYNICKDNTLNPDFQKAPLVADEVINLRESVSSASSACDKKGVLGECVPNPTNGNATISYDLFTGGVVEIQLYNSIGQLVKSLPQGNLSKGSYKATISVAGLPVGVYHYTLVVNNERVDGKKVVVNF